MLKKGIFRAAFDDKKAPTTVLSAFFINILINYFVMVTRSTAACLFAFQ